MVDIESRMESEIDLQMENSIQRAVKVMMEQMRLEQYSLEATSHDGTETNSSVQGTSVARQDSKKRDRKRTPTKATVGRAMLDTAPPHGTSVIYPSTKWTTDQVWR